jgi:hypothetical protein
MSDASRLFEVLSARTRRQVLFRLCEADSIQVPEALESRGEAQPKEAPTQTGQMPPSALAQPSSDELELYHVHLPKLEAHGLTEWEQETNTVSQGPKFGAIEPAPDAPLSNAAALPLDLL